MGPWLLGRPRRGVRPRPRPVNSLIDHPAPPSLSIVAVNRIADYALIGDCHSAALVGRDGSIDWACFPRFDSPALFSRILDEEHGGSFSLAPSARTSLVARSYLPDTNVLVTTFETRDGVLEVTDCMPVAPL